MARILSYQPEQARSERMTKHGDWTQHDIPDQTGKVAIVTGANSGIGFEAARELARRGAQVVLACRSEAKAGEAIEQIRAQLPAAQVEFMALDLADLDQIRSFAAAVHERFDHLDLLINNAGVMIPPASKTKQGFELQLGVNHLGHFALTGLVLDLLLARAGARVVTVSSQAHRQGKIHFDDLDFDKRGYKPMLAYGQSKLANLLFTFELARRLKAADGSLGSRLIVAAAHPGWTNTNLQQHNGLIERINPIFGMKPLAGALPTLRAATDPAVESGDYFGPDGLFEMRGAPVRVGTTRRAKDPAAARRLWEVSEQRTGVRYPFEQASAAA
jgi:NAD(P)-dependent dehydrogenase (short-subunit alcohol dehydrogenase family)